MPDSDYEIASRQAFAVLMFVKRNEVQRDGFVVMWYSVSSCANQSPIRISEVAV